MSWGGGHFALLSPAELRLDLLKRDCSQSNDLQSTALRSTDDDDDDDNEIVSINSVEKKNCVSRSYRRCTTVYLENNYFLMQPTTYLFLVNPNLRP